MKKTQMDKRILIVEDEPDLRKALKIRLEKEGFELILCKSGEECLQKVPEISPNLIVMDLILPGINGFETTSILKHQPQSKNIPIVMLTVRATPTSIERGYKEGADAYFTKPFVWKELIRKIKTYF